MADSVGGGSGGHPNLNLTPDEKRVYGQLFKEADPDGFGAVSGDVAVKFFEKTKLPADVLGQIWQLADTENRGFLTPSGFGVVLRLIGHAQAGRTPSAQLATQPAPIPRFDSPPMPPVSAQATGASTTSSPQGPPPIRVPPLTPEKVNEYSALFEKSGAEDGTLPGVVAKQIFERARLPNEVLGRIWNLSDVRGRGALDTTEFVIAMHLLASYKGGAMRGVPNTLPPGLYEAASRRRPTSFPRPGSASAFVPQPGGYSTGRPQSPQVRQQAGTPVQNQATGDAWAVTPADKARFDQIFATLDTQHRGYITGDQAVEFFGNARLPEETLAQIWDLADINSEGQLNKDEFAVAMYLIKEQRATKDGRGVLPQSLPPALIPPSLRRQPVAPPQPTAPAFENAHVNQSRSAADDLFGLDALAGSPAPQQLQQSTGSTDAGPFANPPGSIAPAPTSSSFRPFMPQSSFGQSILPQPTGSPSPQQSRGIAPAPSSDDLLGDGDPEISNRLTNETSELANLSTQVGSLSTQMTEVQGSRAQSEQQLAQSSQQKRQFESRLGLLRTQYESEVKEVKAVQSQLAASRNDTKRMQQDIAMIEGTQHDLQAQRQQLSTALQADQQENASLKEKIRQMNAEIEQLKPQLEKLKSEARQQKGLVAINRKQLSTNEAERERIKAELATAIQDKETHTKGIAESSQQLEASKRELEEHTRQLEVSHRELEEHTRQLKASHLELEEHTRQLKASHLELEEHTRQKEASRLELEEHTRQREASRREIEESARQLESSRRELEEARVRSAEASEAAAAAASTASATRSPPAMASPTSSMSSNPFFNRAAEPAFSPPIQGQESSDRNSAFDSIFGPSFSTSTFTPAPATSFRNDTPGQSREVSGMTDSSLDSPASPMPTDLVEPPAPPKSRQITSAALPFRTPLDRADSVSSSVRVAPPASRLSPADTPRAVTPTGSASENGLPQDPFGTETPTKAPESDGFFNRSEPKFESAQAEDHQPEESDLMPTTSLPGAFPAETPRSEVSEPSFATGALAAGAGAATLAAGAGIAAVATHEHEHEQKQPTPQMSTEGSKAKQPDFDEMFGGPAHQRSDSEKAADFDSTFADMKKESTTNGAPRSTEEFPAIKELDADDSSEYSDETPMGFEDDFNTKPPAVPPKEPEDALPRTTEPEVASAVPSRLAVQRPPFESASSTGSSLPGIESQTSPPTYGDSVPNNDPNHFPPEFKGLLPAREDPTSPPPAGGESSSAGSAAGAPPAYGPEVTSPRSTSESHPAPAVPSKSSPFDFDDVFAGMGAAKPEDDDEEEDPYTAGRPNAHEFDPTFDSPSQSRSTTATSNAPTSVYSAVTNGPTSSKPPTTSNFDDFENSSRPWQATSAQPSASPAAASSPSHDWDSMFAGLDSNTSPNINDLGLQRQTTLIGDSTAAETTVAPVEDEDTFPIATSPPPQFSPPTTAAPSKLSRPTPGRALSTGTEHDDPILKRLTAMGWNREESLKALEQFDYNIDKAADYLTFK